ncbi:MAG: 30S ribosomal protein S1 [Thermoanaerobaculia bacterium]
MPSTQEQPRHADMAGTPAEGAEGAETSFEELARLYEESLQTFKEGEIVRGTVLSIGEKDVLIDVGLKSEGLVSIDEFKGHGGAISVQVGDKVDVLLEKAEDAEGHIQLSRQKAERLMVWNDLEAAYREGSAVRGRVVDRIKGGLTVDVGVRAFLPGSLVDIKPVKNLESLKGQDFELKVISLDRRRNNVVVSRKAVLEKEYEHKKQETLERLAEGAVLPGVVKNITDYGVFVDLGGIDGLLHITDISWGRVNHPSEHFSVGDEIEVVVLKFDPETERVSLGYKQRTDDPWSLVDKKYPLGARVRGHVVSLVDYGAFVELEPGVEGLIHVSEMSWTKKVVNPAKVLAEDQTVEAIVSELDLDQRRISLSLRQAERNPWEDLLDTHPVGSIVEGKVRNLTDFGAFVEITEEIDGLVHVSDMSWTKRVKHPSEVLQKGDRVRARIAHIDVENQRVSLSIKEFLPNEWDDFMERFKVGDTVTGRVVNVADFGLFVDVYKGLEGLVHISEIDLPGGRLEGHYEVGEWVSARVLRVEEDERKVGLTMRGVAQPTADQIAELEGATGAAGESPSEAKTAAQEPVEGPVEEPVEEPAAESAEESDEGSGEGEADEESAAAEEEE